MDKKYVVLLEILDVIVAVVMLPFACINGSLFWIISDVIYIVFSFIILLIGVFSSPKVKNNASQEEPFNDLSQEQIEMIKQAQEKNRKIY